MEVFIIIIFSYLFGSIPFGFILTKVFLKKDIRSIGSGNIGATNALRAGNRTIGFATLFLDIFKAIIPVLYIKQFHFDLIYISSLCIFLGHVFPIWLNFKGGKGVATYLGILLSINIIYGIIFIIIWLFVFLISKYSSLSSIIACLGISMYVFIQNLENLTFFPIILVLVIYTHRENIKRLKNKEENKTKIY